MPNKNYLKGRRAEYALMARLRKDGWTVFRTAGSHGEVDVIAVRRFPACGKRGDFPVGVRWYQVKQGAKPSKQDWDKLAKFCALAQGMAVSTVAMVHNGKVV